MLQGLHHHQQQLAALLTAALPKEDTSKAVLSTSSVASTIAASTTPLSEEEESSRVAAVTSLHRAILYPPNSLLVAHSASFLAQGFSQLVTDKLYSVRLAAATAYGALCSVLCLISTASNGRQNHVLLSSLIDRFIGWSLQSLKNTGTAPSELALESLHEFLNVGDAGAVNRFALPILKACQELIEDEKTSANLLHRLLGVLALISLKFFRCFQPHFMDIVDLLLGWAMVPDIAESDKRAIMDSFLQFQKHWVNNMQFSLGLLSKFLGDMDLLLQDGSLGTQQFKRLLALLSCFCTVLQSVASGLLELNFLDQLNEPLSKMVPVLLRCLSLMGMKFGWSMWMENSWKCLTLLAEILSARFSPFYRIAADILFQSLEMESVNTVMETEAISSFQIHGLLKTNLQLLSLQKVGLMPFCVQNILRFDGPISQLRLHPNHLVTGSAAATYIFSLQHGKDDVVEKAIDSLIEELLFLWCKLEQVSGFGFNPVMLVGSKCYPTSELIALIKFDFKVLLSCLCVGGGSSLMGQAEFDTLNIRRVEKLVSFMMGKLNPFCSPLQDSVELQVAYLGMLERLATVEFLGKISIQQLNREKKFSETSSTMPKGNENFRISYLDVVLGIFSRYSKLLVQALGIMSPFAVKIEALKWIMKFCENVIKANRNAEALIDPCQSVACWVVIEDLMFSILAASSDREPKVRTLTGAVIEMLLTAKVVHPMYFHKIADMILEKLGDPENDIKNVYLKLLSNFLPLTIYICGLCDFTIVNLSHGVHTSIDKSPMHWKQLFALRQMPQRIHSQQLVSILSYISQRWKVSLSSWILRLIVACRRIDSVVTYPEDAFVDNDSWQDIKLEEDILERICSVNHLAGAWWAIHEAARFCIITRLRTNLGGPTQTFAALERMLLDISHVLQLETDQNDENLNIIGSYARLLPMRLLLEFVEALKKNVYNAYEGSVMLHHTSKQSLLFFRANKKVCEEWFSRINEPMMHAGVILQCQDATVHYCTLRLIDLSNLVTAAALDKSKALLSENLQNTRERYAGDIFRILQNMALALCKKREPEVLVGLQKWAIITFSPLFKEKNQGSSDGLSLEFSWITGLVYQARGQHEKAAAHYIHLLQNEESLSSMGAIGIQFVIGRIIESYTAISDWKSLESWLSDLQTIRARYVGKNYAGALTTAGNEINSVQALARFDEGDFQAARSYLGLTPKSSSELTPDPKLSLLRSEQMLLQAMLLHVEGEADKVPDSLKKAKSMLQETFSILPLDALVDTAPHIIQLHCISAFEDNLKHKDNSSNTSPSLLTSYIETGLLPCNGVYQDSSLWLKVLRVHQNTLPTSPVTLELCKNLLILSRKQRNPLLATRLRNYLKHHTSLCSDDSLSDYFTASLEYEDILVMRADNRVEEALTKLWAFVHPSMADSAIVSSNLFINTLTAKACLKFLKWLVQDFTDKNLEGIILKMQADFAIDTISPVQNSLSCVDGYPWSQSGVEPIIEKLAGAARKLSSDFCPMIGKSWILYASWCYKLANASVTPNHEASPHSCSFSSLYATKLQPDRYILTEKEKLRVEDIVREHIQKKSDKTVHEEKCDYDSVATEWTYGETDVKYLLRQVVDCMEAAAGAPGADDYDGTSLPTALSSQLQKCFLSSTFLLEEPQVLSTVNHLVDIWWCLRKRRVSLFGLAAQAYTNFLLYSSSKYFNGQLFGYDVDAKYKHASYNLRAMLHVLHILVNYGGELRDTLEPALSKVPLLTLQEVIPQLFARLNFRYNEVIRKQLEQLLNMLAKHSPCSVVYPILVDVNSQEKEPSEELQKILAYLNKLYPRLVQDAQLMIKELENVTVLWEELWLGTLQDLHSDVARRVNLLKEEAARIAENTTLGSGEKNRINAAKYSAMMAPIFVVLERRLASTSRRPETPHEIWFFEEYQQNIKAAVSKFKAPPASAAALGDVWKPFENMAASLALHQRKSSVSLGEVAPQLAALLSSDAPMPGLEKQITMCESEINAVGISHGIVTISSFSEQVSILPTKTKPKKIVIVGSDGRNYTYLLKGREDLRLDARIMQLLQSLDGILQSSTSTRGQSLGIRYYSVTPISGRAGLIQWVDNVISIYSVFKSWQNRVLLSQNYASGTSTKYTAPVARPSDMFYGKIIPALKEKGIRRVISRRDWPHDVKRKVLLDLMKETPKQLLHQELWCSSEGFKAFNSKMKRYSGTLAAMSIVGHIVGLGDRHLDNILIDFCTGDIVHIDYNVCFDKGRRLKIPEIVPFRLTQMIETALGLTGIEGSFRSNCQSVLGVLRKNKDIILMLLEVFVWDPLVEWTRANFHDDAAVVGEERRGMELAVSLSLFASRVQEIRIPLQEHHDLLLSTLPAIESAIERFCYILCQYEIVSGLFKCADQERSSLALNETSAKLFVAEATCSSETTRALFEIQAREFTQAHAIVIEKGREAATWVEQHGRILDALRKGSIPEINASNNPTQLGEALSLTSAVLVAGVPLTVVPEPTQIQCHDIDREVSHFVDELNYGLSSAVTALQMYSLALQRILPLNYLTASPVHGWAQVMLSLNTLSSDIISIARRQGAELINGGHNSGFSSINGSYDDLCLKLSKYAADIERLEEECSELNASICPGTESKAKERLLTASMSYMKHSDIKNRREEIEEKRERIQFIWNSALNNLFTDVKRSISKSLGYSVGERNSNFGLLSDLESFFNEFESQIEKCVLVIEFLNYLSHHLGLDIREIVAEANNSSNSWQGNWASLFKTSLQSCKNFVANMTEVVIPTVLKSAISSNSDVLDIFGFISQIRGSIEISIDQLIQVELEKASVMELEQNYFVKIGLITEQQLALEEAAVKGREHLSWEEAEELASQEEACRVQLEKLHRSWNQKDQQTSLLMKKEASINSTLASIEHQLQNRSMVKSERDSHALSREALLATVTEAFCELESIDTALNSIVESSTHSSSSTYLSEIMNSGYSVSDHVWKFPGLLSSCQFFIWKVSVMDLLLDSCMHNVAMYFDQNIGFEQLVDVVQTKLGNQLKNHIDRYLIERVVPFLLARLDSEIMALKLKMESGYDHEGDETKERDCGVVGKVQIMLEEYCNTHETVRAARSASTIMQRRVNELKDALLKTSLEISQMEWMYDMTLNPLQNVRMISHKFIGGNDDLLPLVLSISRHQLIENMQSSVSKIALSLEGLQCCERTSITTEGQLERAMCWACGGPNSGHCGNIPARNLGIPPEFHDHLIKRRQLLQGAQENASEIMKYCTSILEFEASREGVFGSASKLHPFNVETDTGIWQQSYLNALTKLGVSYHSFTHAEQEWKLAQSNIETASSGLASATTELCIASMKANSASGDFQSTLLAMRDSARELSVALSAYGGIIRGHSTLTSECGSMIEEVMAITENLHDVHNLGKEAVVLHCSLMEDLSKANAILLPLELLLSKDVAAMTEVMSMEKETNLEIPPIHGQALFQSYYDKIRDALQGFKPLVLPLTFSVKELYLKLTKLAKAANLHAGNLHKALEGLGESLQIKSQDVGLLRENLVDQDIEYDTQASDRFSNTYCQTDGDSDDEDAISLLERGWVSPPESVDSSSAGSDFTSAEAHTDSYIGPDVRELLPGESAVNENGNCPNLMPSPLLGADNKILQESDESDYKVEASLFHQDKVDEESHGTAFTNVVTVDQAHWSKNSYAVSILRRAEMKLDGRDITDKREISIAEQVDFLLKQATNLDNLCNMYEGWTPWI